MICTSPVCLIGYCKMEQFFHSQNITAVAPDIYHTKFLNETIADSLATLLSKEKRWKKGAHDRLYSTHDIPLNEHCSDMYELIKEEFDTVVIPAMDRIWSFGHPAQVDTIFAVKYSRDTQKKLKEHIDESYISGSIKLNTNYTGADLQFPRQGYSNTDVAVGDLLVWPSHLTHPHLCTEIHEGEKYALTIWTDVKNSS